MSANNALMDYQTQYLLTLTIHGLIEKVGFHILALVARQNLRTTPITALMIAATPASHAHSLSGAFGLKAA